MNVLIIAVMIKLMARARVSGSWQALRARQQTDLTRMERVTIFYVCTHNAKQ